MGLRSVLRYGYDSSLRQRRLITFIEETNFSGHLLHLTARFFDHARALSPDRLVYKALMESAGMARSGKDGAAKTWYAKFDVACGKLGVPLDSLAPPVTRTLVHQALRDSVLHNFNEAVSSRSRLRLFHLLGPSHTGRPRRSSMGFVSGEYAGQGRTLYPSLS
ncbi:hypothetical protein G7K_4364-t1 [Saitoella complicata NRRL Y-17804]|uniref:Uncharacterized protein n=1 Tax=Saitoella complicata (strain BCRC 22490 / CBS 7301 / JCM 7358 / NBRC 10748 / NRRL Y-17804) TaxID=698492 RepID=A0A0E9NK24_SAICN|nr:hypothetical protein G7K_4364-t1 [Saitoella complicata NRRL Y-17804]